MSNVQKYEYPSEKLSNARRMLMAPHPHGDAPSFAGAFVECNLGLPDISEIDYEPAREWIQLIRNTMDTTGCVDPNNRGLWLVKAESLSVAEKREFSRALDELASWVDSEFWRA